MIQIFNSQDELDDEFERIEEVIFEHLALKEVVTDAQTALEEAEKELLEFEENNNDTLLIKQ